MADLLETWAVVAAAGSGTRLGADVPKAFAGLAGRPLLAYAIELFEDHSGVDGIVLVVPEKWEEPASLLADELAAGKVWAAVAGAATRSESIARGLDEVPGTAGVVLVHDAARPLAPPGLIDRVVAGLAEAEGAVPGLPLADTVKRVSGDRVVETLDRSQLVAVQTPQAFRAAALRAAYARPRAELAQATDCASLLEQAGRRVVVVAGEVANLKVTDRDDLARAERLLDRVDDGDGG